MTVIPGVWELSNEILPIPVKKATTVYANLHVISWNSFFVFCLELQRIKCQILFQNVEKNSLKLSAFITYSYIPSSLNALLSIKYITTLLHVHDAK